MNNDNIFWWVMGGTMFLLSLVKHNWVESLVFLTMTLQITKISKGDVKDE